VPRPFEAFEKVRAQLLLPDKDGTPQRVNVTGVVVRTAPIPSQPQRANQAGGKAEAVQEVAIFFNEISESARRTIDSFVRAHSAEW